MSTPIAGVVTNGVVIPESPLPEGARVEIHMSDKLEIPPELQEELDAWQRASAGTIEMVERLAEEMEADEKGITGRVQNSN